MKFEARIKELVENLPDIAEFGADSEEKHEPVSDIDTAALDSLKALDPKRPIREADTLRVTTRTVLPAEMVSALPC